MLVMLVWTSTCFVNRTKRVRLPSPALRDGAAWKLVWLITKRPLVQIQLPLPRANASVRTTFIWRTMS